MSSSRNKTKLKRSLSESDLSDKSSPKRLKSDTSSEPPAEDYATKLTDRECLRFLGYNWQDIAGSFSEHLGQKNWSKVVQEELLSFLVMDIMSRLAQERSEIDTNVSSTLIHVNCSLETLFESTRDQSNTLFFNVYLVMPVSVMDGLFSDTRQITRDQLQALLFSVSRLLTNSIVKVVEQGLHQRAVNALQNTRIEPSGLWLLTKRLLVEMTCLGAKCEPQQTLVIGSGGESAAICQRYYVLRRSGASVHSDQLNAVLRDACNSTTLGSTRISSGLESLGENPIWESAQNRLRTRLDEILALDDDILPERRGFFENVIYMCINSARADFDASGDVSAAVFYRQRLDLLLLNLGASAGLPIVFREIFLRILEGDLSTQLPLFGDPMQSKKLTASPQEVEAALPSFRFPGSSPHSWYSPVSLAKRFVNSIMPDNSCAKLSKALGSTGEECAICGSKYEYNSRLRLLPCNHAYHANCIDVWLKNYVNECCLCRRKPL